MRYATAIDLCRDSGKCRNRRQLTEFEFTPEAAADVASGRVACYSRLSDGKLVILRGTDHSTVIAEVYDKVGSNRRAYYSIFDVKESDYDIKDL